MSDNKSSFDKLVEGLDSDDRKEMLQRINSTSNQSVQFIDRDKRTVQRVLKKLCDNNLIEWIGTSSRDPRKVYRIKK